MKRGQNLLFIMNRDGQTVQKMAVLTEQASARYVKAILL
jgi:hypothetical protein